MLAGGEELKIAREDFNRIAKTMPDGICWVKDDTNPGTPEPHEVAMCNAKKGNIYLYVKMDSPSLCSKAVPVGFQPKFSIFHKSVVEKLRQELIAKELGKTTVVEIATDLDDYQLNPAQKKMVQALLIAGETMDSLYQIQRGIPSDKNFSGTADDLEFARRYQSLWCEDKNPFCVADSRFPELKTPLYPGKNLDCAQLQGDWTNPFSAVGKIESADGNVELKTVPYSQSEFGWVQTVASFKLKTAATAAREAKEPAMADYIDAVADALSSDKPFPYVDSDKKWIAAKNSRFFLRIGADEVGNDQGCQTKAMYEMVLGIKDPVAEENIKKLTRNNQILGDYLGRLIPGYQPRKIVVETPEFVDVLMMSGEAKGNIKGSMIGQTLPNWCGEDGKAECQTRIMIYTNNTKMAYNKELLEALKEVLAPEVLDHIKTDTIGNKTVLHEISHNLGPQMKAYPQLGDMLGRLEELKAEIGGVALHPKLEELGLAKPEERKNLYAGLLAWCLGHIRRSAPLGEKFYEARSSYQQLAAVIVGYFTEQGAYSYKDGRWSVVWDKVPDAAKNLYTKVGEVYLKGDRKGVEDFFKQYTSGDGLKYLHLDRVDATIGLDKVPVSVFSYKVTGFGDEISRKK